MISSFMSAVSSGTAVGYETLTWDLPTEASYGRSDLRAALRQTGQYQAAIPAEIANLEIALPSMFWPTLRKPAERSRDSTQNSATRSRLCIRLAAHRVSSQLEN